MELLQVLSVVSPLVVVFGVLFWARRVERRLDELELHARVAREILDGLLSARRESAE